jgi:hypothetical protein
LRVIGVVVPRNDSHSLPLLGINITWAWHPIVQVKMLAIKFLPEVYLQTYHVPTKRFRALFKMVAPLLMRITRSGNPNLAERELPFWDASISLIEHIVTFIVFGSLSRHLTVGDIDCLS